MLAIYTKLRVKSLVEKLPSGFIFDNFFLDPVVPGGGFEPPTRGFSVHCSTPELPGRPDALPLVSAFYCVLSRLSRGFLAENCEIDLTIMPFVKARQ